MSTSSVLHRGARTRWRGALLAPSGFSPSVATNGAVASRSRRGIGRQIHAAAPSGPSITVQAMSVSNVLWVAGALGLGLSAATLAQGTNPPADQAVAVPDTSAISPDMVDAGRRLFHGRGTCSACHGMRLEGGPIAPPLTAHAWRDAKGGDLAAIFYIDTHGVRGTVMVSHPGGISDAEAVRVAIYIWSVGHGRAKP